MPLEKISEHDISVINDDIKKELINEILLKLYALLNPEDKSKVNLYIQKDTFVNDDLFLKYLSYFPSPFPENSLQQKSPSIAQEWDYTKNFP